MREPSARTWITRPRMPGVGDDQVAPPPQHEMREATRPREAHQGAQLVGVVDRREQVGRSADAHRGEPGERLVARRLDPDPALDVGPGGDRVEGIDHRWPPRATRSISLCSGKGWRVAAASTSAATAAAAPGSTQAAGRSRHDGVALRVLEQAGRVEERVGIEVLVRDQARRAGLDQARRVRPLVTGRVRVRDDDHRQAHRAHLGQRRRSGPPDDQVRGRQRGQHLVTQERVRPVASAHGRRQGLAPGQRRRVAVIAGHVDDRHPFDQAGQGVGDRGVEAADRLGATEDQQDTLVGRHVHPLTRRDPVDRVDVADRGPGHEAGTVRERPPPGHGTSPRTRRRGRRRGGPSPGPRGPG